MSAMSAMRATGEALLCLACAAALVALDWAYLYRRYGYHKLSTRGGVTA